METLADLKRNFYLRSLGVENGSPTLPDLEYAYYQGVLSGMVGVDKNTLYSKAPRISLAHNTFNSFNYTEIRIVNGVGVPGVISKKIANGGESASNLAYQGVDSVSRRYGASCVVNGSSWDVATNVLRNLQIKDGKILKEDEGDGYAKYVLGIKRDGTLKIYPLSDSSGKDLINDGVVDTFGHREAYVINSSPVAGLTTSPEVSARTIIAWDSSDIYLILIHGVTGTSGASQIDAQTLCVSRNFEGALALDGGGSTQGVLNGYDVHPSSDATRRLVPDFIVVNAPFNGSAISRWYSPALTANFRDHTVPTQFRVKDGELESRGALINEVQVSGTTEAAFTFPWWARPPVHQRIPISMGNNPCYFDVAPTGIASRFINTLSASPTYINPVKYTIR